MKRVYATALLTASIATKLFAQADPSEVGMSRDIPFLKKVAISDEKESTAKKAAWTLKSTLNFKKMGYERENPGTFYQEQDNMMDVVKQSRYKSVRGKAVGYLMELDRDHYKPELKKLGKTISHEDVKSRAVMICDYSDSELNSFYHGAKTNGLKNACLNKMTLPGSEVLLTTVLKDDKDDNLSTIALNRLKKHDKSRYQEQFLSVFNNETRGKGIREKACFALDKETNQELFAKLADKGEFTWCAVLQLDEKTQQDAIGKLLKDPSGDVQDKAVKKANPQLHYWAIHEVSQKNPSFYSRRAASNRIKGVTPPAKDGEKMETPKEDVKEEVKADTKPVTKIQTASTKKASKEELFDNTFKNATKFMMGSFTLTFNKDAREYINGLEGIESGSAKADKLATHATNVPSSAKASISPTLKKVDEGYASRKKTKASGHKKMVADAEAQKGIDICNKYSLPAGLKKPCASLTEQELWAWFIYVTKNKMKKNDPAVKTYTELTTWLNSLGKNVKDSEARAFISAK